MTTNEPSYEIPSWVSDELSDPCIPMEHKRELISEIARLERHETQRSRYEVAMRTLRRREAERDRLILIRDATRRLGRWAAMTALQAVAIGLAVLAIRLAWEGLL